ncbi:NTP/NDP exchange transporter [Gemmatimonadota bacterium]
MAERDSNSGPIGPRVSLLARLVEVRPEEIQLLLLSCAYFFFVLTSYYIIRPIRDEMGVAGGVENLAWLFTGTLLGTLMVHPLYTWLVARYPRKRFVPLAYRFFIANLLLFFLLLETVPEGAYVWVGRIFFNWTSVFNLFVVSVFWSFMADIFRSGQGKRLFGFIGVGGTLGAILGSSLTVVLAESIGPVNLLLVSAFFLEMAVRCVKALGRRVTGEGEDSELRKAEEEPIGGGVLGGLTGVARSPYLLAIVAYMFLFTTTGTSLYFQQARIVEENFADPGARTAFFATIDVLVNVLTLGTQVFLTGRIIKWLGLGVALAILPAVTMAGFLGLGLYPTVAMLVVFQVLRRGWNYGLMRPAMEALYTVIPREDKYKAKNLIDTFIYRSGDQVGAWSHRGMEVLGLGVTGVAFVNVPVAGLWLLTGLGLGLSQQKKAAKVGTGLGTDLAPASSPV